MIEGIPMCCCVAQLVCEKYGHGARPAPRFSADRLSQTFELPNLHSRRLLNAPFVIQSSEPRMKKGEAWPEEKEGSTANFRKRYCHGRKEYRVVYLIVR